MKKYVLLLIMIMTLTCTLFAQYFEYVSLGYNTVKHTKTNGDEIRTYYYFLNNEQYSDYLLDSSYPSLLYTQEKRTIKENNAFYNGVAVGTFMHGGDFLYFEKEEGYEFDGNREIYRVANGKLIYVELDSGRYASSKIEYNNTGLTVTMQGQGKNAGDNFLLKFYNIPKEELYNMVISRLKDMMETIITYALTLRKNMKMR